MSALGELVEGFPVRTGSAEFAVQDILTTGTLKRASALLVYLKAYAWLPLRNSGPNVPSNRGRSCLPYRERHRKARIGGVSTDISAGTGVFIPAGRIPHRQHRRDAIEASSSSRPSGFEKPLVKRCNQVPDSAAGPTT